MDEIRQGLRSELERKRGMLATVVESGTVHAGDTVHVITSVAAG